MEPTARRLPLELTVEDFRTAAERVLDAAARYLEALDESRVMPDSTGRDTVDAFTEAVPEQGLGLAAFDGLDAVARHARAGNGRMFAYVVGSGEPVAALGDLYASLLNQNATSWRAAPSASVIERVVVGWLATAVGCAGFTGSLTSGGSAANLMGLATAREATAPANEHGAQPSVVYASNQVHMSIPKAIALLGIGRANLRLVDVDQRFRLRPDALVRAIDEDRRRGRRGIAVVATAGTTQTGAVDPVGELAEIAHDKGLWLHVDGAYGALAALVEPDLFAGLDRADSVSVDAHKWLYQPLDCSAILFRDGEAARRAFAFSDDYVRPFSRDPVEGFSAFDESIELSRRFRALKLWLSLRYHGLAAFRRAIANDLEHARRLAAMVADEPALELLAPVELSTVCFRWIGGSHETLDSCNAEILRRVTARGNVLLSNANVRGALALRACFVNNRTTDADVAAVIADVLAAAEE